MNKINDIREIKLKHIHYKYNDTPYQNDNANTTQFSLINDEVKECKRNQLDKIIFNIKI